MKHEIESTIHMAGYVTGTSRQKVVETLNTRFVSLGMARCLSFYGGVSYNQANDN